MRYRERHRVDWDEEIRKTERIRRKGIFISALGFGVAVLIIFGTNRSGVDFADVWRKLAFALCIIMAMFLMMMVWRRREHLKREKQEKEQEKIIEQMRLDAQKREQ